MPYRVVTHPKERLTRSLGRLAYWWIHNFVVYGDGSVYKQPVTFGPERVQELVHMYALDENGKRLYNHAFLSKPKGADKSGFAAYVACFEVAGPSRFAGWARGGETFEYLGKTYVYRAGEPMGRLVNQPRVRCLATEEGQTGLIYDTVLTNFEEGPLSELGAATFGGYIELPRLNGGRVEPTTSGASSKDGGRDTFVAADEALALGTPVQTPYGPVPIEYLKRGDLVIGSDGWPTEVVKATDVMEQRDCCRVVFEDNTSVVTSAGHLWRYRQSGRPWQVGTTEHMASLRGHVFVPRVAGVVQRQGEMPDELPVDPWLLGCWLGDGDARNATVTVGEQDLASFQTALPLGVWASRCETHAGTPRFYVRYDDSGARGTGFKHDLAELGVLGDKHVPDRYLYAGSTARMQLVRGLMDSDGCANKNGTVTFVNCNERLLRAVVELLRSLGEKVSGVNWRADARSRTGRVGKVEWTPRLFVPFTYSRKVARCAWQLHGARGESIRVVSIERVDSVPVKCIGVAAADHLFLAGEGCALTHNTHLWFTPALKRAFHTVSRNLTKRPTEEPWLFETTTMYKPGQNSIAEETYEVSKMADEGRLRRDSRLLFIHRWGQITEDEMVDEAKLRAALVDAEGDAAEWLDQDRIIDDIYSPDNDVNESIRYYLNALAGSAASWLTPAQIEAAKTQSSLQPGDSVALGFDGSLTGDSTALVAVRLEDNLVQLLHIQEAPTDSTAKTWSVDQDMVDAAVAAAFRDFEVKAFFADPPFWQDRIERWELKWGKQLAPSTRQHPIMWWTSRRAQMAAAVEAAHTLVTTGEARIHDDAPLIRHLNNACRGGKNDELIYKESKMSRHKIDAAVTMVVALKAASVARTFVPKETKVRDPNHGIVSSVPLDMLVPKGYLK